MGIRIQGVMTVCLLAVLQQWTSGTVLPVRADEPAPIRVPLEILPSGHMAVEATINGKGPFRMILDTGSPITLLSGSAAQKSGLITATDAKQPALMGMRGQFALKSLRIGDLKATDVNVLVMDHPTVQLLSQLEGRIDGILGFAFYSRYRTTLDYAERQVSFVPVAYTPQDVIATVMGRLMGGEERRVVAPTGLWGLALDKPDSAPGLNITQVYPQSAAAAAGLKVGDRLLTLDGRWTDTLIDCYEAASLAPVGQEVSVKVLRAGKDLELPIRPRKGL